MSGGGRGLSFSASSISSSWPKNLAFEARSRWRSGSKRGGSRLSVSSNRVLKKKIFVNENLILARLKLAKTEPGILWNHQKQLLWPTTRPGRRPRKRVSFYSKLCLYMSPVSLVFQYTPFYEKQLFESRNKLMEINVVAYSFLAHLGKGPRLVLLSNCATIAQWSLMTIWLIDYF